MPVLMSRQNAAVVNKAVIMKRPTRALGKSDQGRKGSVGSASDRNVDESNNVEESGSMSVDIQPESEQKQQGRPHTSEIETKKNSVEIWLKSQLGLEGSSCKTIIEAHLVDKFHSRAKVEKRIRWEIGIFITYILFLVFYSFAACGTNTQGKQLVRSLIGPAVGDFSSVQSIGRTLIHETIKDSHF
jgi:hypothetical protein